MSFFARSTSLIALALAIAIATAATRAMAGGGFQFDQVSTVEGRLLGDYVMSGSKLSKAVLLHLDGPIDIAASQESADPRNRRSKKDVTKINVTLASAAGADVLGKRVVLRGRLIRQRNELHHTDVDLIEAEVLSAVDAGDDAVASYRTRP